ncbi:MAG: ketopantoate reductase family protein [Nanoarchaeota archaeon]|nr:ketopantoate reductase family protein [Nanoarchaeota archaeon]
MVEKIHIIGAGAIGGLIGGYLTEKLGKEHIVLIDKNEEYVENIKKNKLNIIDYGNTEKLIHLIDVNIKMPDEIDKGELENVILSTKSYSNDEVLKYLDERVKDINFLILQNGYDRETIKKLPNAIRGVEFGFACQVEEDGLIRNAIKGKYIIGRLDKKPDSEIDFWTWMLNKGGIKAEKTNNLEGDLWSKLLINSALNPVSAITGYSLREIIKDKDSRNLFMDIYKEGYPIVKKDVKKLGNLIGSPGLINRVFKYSKLSNAILNQVSRKFGDVESSMLQDVRKGRKTEIDYINGEIILLGTEYSIPTPLNDEIYSMIKQIERGEQEICPKNVFPILNQGFSKKLKSKREKNKTEIRKNGNN